MLRTAMLALAASAATACASLPEPAPAAFASERIIVEVRGPARAQGPDVILVPGLSSSPKVWAQTVAANPGRRFHLVQVKGFAGAPAEGNAEGLVAAPVAEEIARYIQAVGLKKPAVVGHSMGGTIALMTAARHPDSVGRVLVVDMLPFMGAMFGPPATTTAESVRPIADQIRNAMQTGPATTGPFAADKIIAGMVKTESARAEPLADSLSSDPKVSANAFHELITTDLRPELAKITVPVTVLYVLPGQSPLNEAQIDQAYQLSYANLRGAKLTRVPDSYHFIMADAPDRFARELQAFLGAGS